MSLVFSAFPVTLLYHGLSSGQGVPTKQRPRIDSSTTLYFEAWNGHHLTRVFRITHHLLGGPWPLTL